MRSLARDGVSLAFEELGSGEPPLVLVHGWTCDHTHFSPQIEHFGRSHRVVALDLRGHGASDKPEQAYTVAGFADDVAWLCRQLDLTGPVLVGHSLGGAVVLEIAARFPALPSAVVVVDAPVLIPGGVGGRARPLIDALYTPAYREAQRAFVSNVLFLPTDDPAVKARVVDQMGSAPQHVMASTFDQVHRWDAEAAIRACQVPTLNISATHPLTDLARFRALCPQLVTGQTVGAGHFIQLLVPDQVNAMLERFLAVYVTGQRPEVDGSGARSPGAAAR